MIRSLAALLILAWLACLIARPADLPIPTIALLLAACWPLILGWNACRGMALRPSWAWAGLAVALGVAVQLQAWSEPLSGGRPIAGHWAYLASLATLAALISVFGARTPGGGAWAILMGMLVLVFLIPWLEGSGLARGTGGLDRLRLDAPWSLFFALIASAGVTNYLPTRRSLPALCVGGSLMAEFAGLLATDWPGERRAMCWSIAPGLLAIGLLAGLVAPGGAPAPSTPLARLWLWFRDAWGVVWALRVRERFNAAAESAGWPVQLSWGGPVAPDGAPLAEDPEGSVRLLAGLLRRFATANRLDGAARGASWSCPEADRLGS